MSVPWSEGEILKKKVITQICILLLIGMCIAGAVFLTASKPQKAVWDAVNYFFDCMFYMIKSKDWGYIKQVAIKPFAIGLSILFYLMLLLVYLITLVHVSKDKPYGDARFARASDLPGMRLVGKKGMIVGKLVQFSLFGWPIIQKWLIPQDLRHGIVLAPTRSGKTAGFAIPTILNSNDTMIVVDPKGELEYKLGDTLRQQGRKVFSLNWADPNSKDCWNPIALSILPEDDIELESHCERVAAMFFPEKSGGDPFWQSRARSHFTTLLLYSIYDAKRQGFDPHISNIFYLMTNFKEDKNATPEEKEENVNALRRVLLDLVQNAQIYGYPIRIIRELSAFARIQEKEQSSHVSSLLDGIALWNSKAIFYQTEEGTTIGSTRDCSFSWEDLRKDQVILFLQFPEKDAQAYGKLTALFFDSFFAWALSNEKKKGEQNVVIVADEFGSLPKITLMANFLSKGAGMGSVIWMIVQDFSQIKKVYGADDFSTIKTNCSFILAYTQNNHETQKELAAMVGKKTITKTNRSFGKGLDSKDNYSESQEGIDLIPVAKWGNIPKFRHILIIQSFHNIPVYCHTPVYFLERRFKKMAKD